MKKHLIMFTCLLLLGSTTAQAGWWFSSPPDPVPEFREKIRSLEAQNAAHHQSLDRWKLISGSLGIGCVLIFVIGTALGAQTRKHHLAYGTGTRRVGAVPTTTTAGLNGRKPHHVGQEPEEDLHTTLAA